MLTTRAQYLDWTAVQPQATRASPAEQVLWHREIRLVKTSLNSINLHIIFLWCRSPGRHKMRTVAVLHSHSGEIAVGWWLNFCFVFLWFFEHPKYLQEHCNYTFDTLKTNLPKDQKLLTQLNSKPYGSGNIGWFIGWKLTGMGRVQRMLNLR